VAFWQSCRYPLAAARVQPGFYLDLDPWRPGEVPSSSPTVIPPDLLRMQ
jgi:hypothetical protein